MLYGYVKFILYRFISIIVFLRSSRGSVFLATPQVAQSHASDDTLELVQHGVELLTPQAGIEIQEITFGHHDVTVWYIL